MIHSNKFCDVSVIIPCYKCSRTIERALNSVFNQTLRPKEIILVDDASGDDTLDVLLDIEKQHHGWVKLIKLNVNLGAGAARNAGLDAAVGHYVAFLDADDSWHEEKLSIQYSWMQAHTDIVMSGHNIIVGNSFTQEKVGRYPIPYKRIFLKNFLIANPLSTPTVMLKNKESYRFPNLRYAEDYGLWLWIASSSECCKLDANLALIHKAPYGEAGLSSNLLKMERGVQSVFINLYKENKINIVTYCLASTFSWIKFIRRVFIARVLP